MLHTIGIRVKEIKITVNHNPSSLRGKNRKKKRHGREKKKENTAILRGYGATENVIH